MAAKAAIAEALAFHQAIGAERKAARLRYLTMRWADRLKNHPQITIHSSLEPGQVWGLANVQIKGVDTREINAYMWDRFRIVLVPIIRDDYEGLRVTPNVYTRVQEIDTFADAMLEIADNGQIPTM